MACYRGWYTQVHGYLLDVVQCPLVRGVSDLKNPRERIVFLNVSRLLCNSIFEVEFALSFMVVFRC